MKYDFDQVVDRRNTNSYKWNVKENELPMWVADMDFPAAPEIRKALQEQPGSWSVWLCRSAGGVV